MSSSDLYFAQTFKTPLGMMIAIANTKALLLLEFTDREKIERQQKPFKNTLILSQNHSLLLQTQQELSEYFEKKRMAFNLPLELTGTPFQKKAWQALLKIPYAQTCSYQEEAHAMGHPKAIRAVANANAANRIAIIIPCHRVIRRSGNLGGYAGGLERKKALLALENN